MHEGIAGLTRDKSRPSWIPPLPADPFTAVGANQVAQSFTLDIPRRLVRTAAETKEPEMNAF